MRDLEEIADFYAVTRQNPGAARRVVEAIRRTCGRAGEAPHLGRDRAELGPGIRSRVVVDYPYLIYFRAAPPAVDAAVQVARILHQARDVESAFTEGAEPG